MAALIAPVARRCCVFALWAALSLWVPLRAVEYQVDQWTTEQGLPQNTILAIAQTPDGYLWLATWNGLVRFDGVRFTVFNSVTTPALPSARIVDVQTDRNGWLWIFSEEDSLTRLADGLTLAKASKADPHLRDIRLVLLTRFLDQNSEAMTREAGFVTSLFKPVRPSTLFNVIMAALAERPEVHAPQPGGSVRYADG